MSIKDRKPSRMASAKQHTEAANISLTGRSISSSEYTVDDDKNDDFVKTLRINSARSKGATPRRVSSKSPRPQLAENHVGPISTFNSIENGGLSDPYVMLKLSHGATAKSKRFNNNLNPVFNETYKLSWNGVDPLEVGIWDFDLNQRCQGEGENDSLGNLIIDAANFDFSSGKSIVITDRRLDNVSRGKISLEISFTAKAGVHYVFNGPPGASVIRPAVSKPQPTSVEVVNLPQLPILTVSNHIHPVVSDELLLSNKFLDVSSGNHVLNSLDSSSAFDGATSTRQKTESFDESKATMNARAHIADLEAIADQLMKVTVEFEIDWEYNPRNLRMDILSGLKMLRDAFHQAVQRVKQLDRQLISKTEENIELRCDLEETFFAFREKFSNLEEVKSAEMRDLQDTVIKLKSDMHLYRAQANDLTIENEKLTDISDTLKRHLTLAQDEILDFPRREERIIRNTEKMMRLKTMSLRQEDNKMRAFREELKQLGFFRSRVDRLELEVSSLKQQLRSRRAVTSAETGMKARPTTAPSIRVASSATMLANESEISNPGEVHTGEFTTVNMKKVFNSLSQPKLEATSENYQSAQIKRLQDSNKELEAKINHLSQSLAAARALPLLQQRTSDEVEFPELFNDDDQFVDKIRKPGENGYYPNFSEDESDNTFSFDGMDNSMENIISEKKESILADISRTKQAEREQETKHVVSREDEIINSIRKKKSFAKLPDDRKSWFTCTVYE